MAFAAGIPKNRQQALDILLTGTAKRTDAFRMNGQFACMLCGVGFDAQIAHEFAQQSTRGLLTYASLTAGHFLKANPYPFEIEANGQVFSTDAFFISIANSNQFGNYVTIAPKASLSDGLLDIVVVKKMAKPSLLFHLIKQVLTGKPIKPERTLQEPVIYFQSQQVKIKNPAEAPIHIDGEPRPSCKELNIEIQRDFFTLLHAS